MNFFIISDNDAFTAELSDKIRQKEKSAKIYKSDFELENLKKNKKHLDSTSLCVIFKAEAAQTEICLLSIFSGFCIAKEIPLITNISQLQKANPFSHLKSKNNTSLHEKENIYYSKNVSINEKITDSNMENVLPEIFHPAGLWRTALTLLA